MGFGSGHQSSLEEDITRHTDKSTMHKHAVGFIQVPKRKSRGLMATADKKEKWGPYSF